MIETKIITGKKCSVSGIWRSDGKNRKIALIKKQGEVIPIYINQYLI